MRLILAFFTILFFSITTESQIKYTLHAGLDEKGSKVLYAQAIEMYDYSCVAAGLHIGEDHITPTMGLGISLEKNKVNFIPSIGLKINYRSFKLQDHRVSHDRQFSPMVLYQVNFPAFYSNTPVSVVYFKDLMSKEFGIVLGFTFGK